MDLLFWFDQGIEAQKGMVKTLKVSALVDAII